MFRSQSLRSSQRLPLNEQPMSCFSTTSIFSVFFFFPLLLRHQRKDQFLCCFSPMGPLARRSRGSTLGGWRRGSRAGRKGRSCHMTQRSFSAKEWVVFARHIGEPWFRLICLFLGLVVIFSFSITFLHNPTVGIIQFAKPSDTDVIWGAHDFMVWMSNMDLVSPT